VPKPRSGETAEKSIWSRNLGGPSLFPSKVWGVRPGFRVVLLAVLAVLCIDQLALHTPVSVPAPRPSPSPTPPPHFALDDLDLGPTVRLTRFFPDFDIYPGNAVEGADGQLYIAYYPDRPPPIWHQIGGEASRLGILNEGQITPIAVSHDKTFNAAQPSYGILDFAGLLKGMPVVIVHEGTANTIIRWVAVSSHGLRFPGLRSSCSTHRDVLRLRAVRYATSMSLADILPFGSQLVQDGRYSWEVSGTLTTSFPTRSPAAKLVASRRSAMFG